MKIPPKPLFLSRRELLGLIGVTAAAPLLASSGSSASPGKTNTSRQEPSCVVRPQQTEGPYFVDRTLNRSDIRPNPSDGAVPRGTPLHLEFHVSRISGGSCTPLRGAIVDVWQCDASGVYSDFRDFNGLFDSRGKRFLRGYQVTDSAGKVEFVTIYPGWYPGRTVHIHFKVRTDPGSRRGHEFTSQVYFDDAITDQVHAQPPYAEKGTRTRRNDGDGLFSRGGDQLMLQLVRSGRGWRGTFDIGLDLQG